MQTEKIEASHSSTKGKFCKQYYETSLKLQPITLPTWTYIYISVYTDKCCRFSWQSCLNTGMCPFYSCGCLKGSKRDQRDLWTPTKRRGFLKKSGPMRTTGNSPNAGQSSQQRQLVDGRVELEVRREEFSSPWVDETIRLSDGDVCNAGDVPDFCGSIASSSAIRSDSQSPACSAVALVM